VGPSTRPSIIRPAQVSCTTPATTHGTQPAVHYLPSVLQDESSGPQADHSAGLVNAFPLTGNWLDSIQAQPPTTSSTLSLWMPHWLSSNTAPLATSDQTKHLTTLNPSNPRVVGLNIDLLAITLNQAHGLHEKSRQPISSAVDAFVEHRPPSRRGRTGESRPASPMRRGERTTWQLQTERHEVVRYRSLGAEL
jgi:hypothetical protein